MKLKISAHPTLVCHHNGIQLAPDIIVDYTILSSLCQSCHLANCVCWLQGCGGVCAQAGCHHWQQSILQRGLQAGEHQPSQQVRSVFGRWNGAVYLWATGHLDTVITFLVHIVTLVNSSIVTHLQPFTELEHCFLILLSDERDCPWWLDSATFSS